MHPITGSFTSLPDREPVVSVKATLTRRNQQGVLEFWNGNEWSPSRAFLLPRLIPSAAGEPPAVNWILDKGLPPSAATNEGAYALGILATDNDGNAGDFEETFTVDHSPIIKIGGGASLTDLAALPLIQGTVQSADGGFGFTAVKVQLYRSNGLPEYWTGSEWSTKGSHLLDTELKAGKMVNSPSTWRRDHDLPPGASLRDGRYCIIAIAFDGDKVVGFSRAAFSIRRGPHLSIISPLSEKTYSAATMPTSLSGTAELGLAGTALTDIMYGISRFSLDGSAQGWNGKVWIKVPARIPPIPLLWVTEPGKSRKGLWKSGSDWPTRDSFTSGQYFVTVTCVDKDGKSSVSTASFKIG